MSKMKISVMAWFVIVLTIIGSVVPQIYIKTVSDGYTLYYGLLPHRLFVSAGFFIALAGFLFGIGGMLIEIRDRKILGIVICVICVLINFIFLDYCCSMDVAAYESNKRVTCASKIKRICTVLQQYAADNAGNFPPANGAAGLEYLRKFDYLTDYAAYICPSTKTVRGKNNQPLSEENVDYVYIGGLNDKTDREVQILYDKANNHEFFGNVGLIDGTVKEIYGNPWTTQIKR